MFSPYLHVIFLIETILTYNLISWNVLYSSPTYVYTYKSCLLEWFFLNCVTNLSSPNYRGVANTCLQVCILIWILLWYSIPRHASRIRYSNIRTICQHHFLVWFSVETQILWCPWALPDSLSMSSNSLLKLHGTLGLMAMR